VSCDDEKEYCVDYGEIRSFVFETNDVSIHLKRNGSDVM
jgi:hypothetical protein